MIQLNRQFKHIPLILFCTSRMICFKCSVTLPTHTRSSALDTKPNGRDRPIAPRQVPGHPTCPTPGRGSAAPGVSVPEYAGIVAQIPPQNPSFWPAKTVGFCWVQGRRKPERASFLAETLQEKMQKRRKRGGRLLPDSAMALGGVFFHGCTKT